MTKLANASFDASRILDSSQLSVSDKRHVETYGTQKQSSEADVGQHLLSPELKESSRGKQPS